MPIPEIPSEADLNEAARVQQDVLAGRISSLRNVTHLKPRGLFALAGVVSLALVAACAPKPTQGGENGAVLGAETFVVPTPESIATPKPESTSTPEAKNLIKSMVVWGVYKAPLLDPNGNEVGEIFLTRYPEKERLFIRAQLSKRGPAGFSGQTPTFALDEKSQEGSELVYRVVRTKPAIATIKDASSDKVSGTLNFDPVTYNNVTFPESPIPTTFDAILQAQGFEAVKRELLRLFKAVGMNPDDAFLTKVLESSYGGGQLPQ